jgi:transcriptional regulator with XRE-family HTH domain
MLSERLRDVIALSKGTQEEFAAAVGISLTRVKNVLTGRVKKLQPHELKAIEDGYNVRSAWLASGDGAMHLPSGSKRMQKEMDLVAQVTRDALEMGLSQEHARYIQRLLYAWHRRDGQEIREVLTSQRPALGGESGTSAWKVANQGFLQDVLDAVSTAAEELQCTLPNEKFSAVVLALYDACIDSRIIPTGRAKQLVKLAM